MKLTDCHGYVKVQGYLRPVVIGRTLYGEHILALDERGDVLLLEPSPKEFKLIDQQKVASNAWAHLAVDDDLVLVRDLSALIVFRWK